VAATRPGMRFIDPHLAAVRVLTQGLIDCKLIEGPLDDAIEQQRYSRFYMHRTGHWLGMDVHDCGEYREPPKPGEKPAMGVEKPWRILKPGMVLTVEPGLYISPAGDIPKEFHGIGIRIEDDALVTNDGCELISSDVPKSVSAIEALMRH
jgi:Xaa-Pro aminopeptidase